MCMYFIDKQEKWLSFDELDSQELISSIQQLRVWGPRSMTLYLVSQMPLWAVQVIYNNDKQITEPDSKTVRSEYCYRYFRLTSIVFISIYWKNNDHHKPYNGKLSVQTDIFNFLNCKLSDNFPSSKAKINQVATPAVFS